MAKSFTTEARLIASRLRGIDRQCVVFGARKHRYTFRTRMEADELEEFEREAGITLPSPYREFLTELGNGGCGPYYGVLPFKRPSQVATPFPHSDTYIYPEDIGDDEFEAPLDGCIEIAEYGCGTMIFLVVSGEAAGQVWFDSRYESGLEPVLGEDGQRVGFDDWWLQYMGKHLEEFERVRELMEAATPHDELHELLEPEILQLHIDEMMLSIMNVSPRLKPSKVRDKPWGVACGIVDDHYEKWQRSSNELPTQNKRMQSNPSPLLRRLLRIWGG